MPQVNELSWLLLLMEIVLLALSFVISLFFLSKSSSAQSLVPVNVTSLNFMFMI